ncbi:hypothetical protein GW17_00028928 [Ensete ventricosum]|nr:hypothetical protein GW17_00028928 [Ensete ventricosum]
MRRGGARKGKEDRRMETRWWALSGSSKNHHSSLVGAGKDTTEGGPHAHSQPQTVVVESAAAAVLVFFKMEPLRLFGAAASWPQEAEQPSFASVTAHVEKQQPVS